MSLIVIVQGAEIVVPQHVEAEGGAAVERYIAERTKPAPKRKTSSEETDA